MDNRRDTIVMVDDDIINLTVARNNLAGRYNIATVPSGTKLFQILEKVTPDLILLDIEMPEMDGYEVLKVLKNKEQTAHIPVVFLTATIDPENELEGLRLGAVDYITKPFVQGSLIRRIDLHILFEEQKQKLFKRNLALEGEMLAELQNAMLTTVAALIECRDDVTGGHIRRTRHYLRMLADVLVRKL